MRIVSLNCWGGVVLEPLLAWLQTVDADVYCLQECGRTAGLGLSWLQYRAQGRELAQRANLFADIAAILPDHQGMFSPTARGTLFDPQGRPVLHEFGLGTFVRKSLPIIGQSLGFIHGRFSPHGFGPYPRAQNAHSIRLYDYQADHSVCITHLHGIRHDEGKADTPERVAQAEALARLVQQTRSGDEPVLVCGDFNILPDSITFETLKAIGLADLVTTRGFVDTRTSYYTKPGRFADYMFASREVRVRSFDVVAEPEVSDHRALLIDID